MLGAVYFDFFFMILVRNQAPVAKGNGIGDLSLPLSRILAGSRNPAKVPTLVAAMYI